MLANAKTACSGTGIASKKLMRIESLPPVEKLALGSIHAAVVTVDDRLFVWGDGRSGNLGLGARVVAPCPTEVPRFLGEAERIVHVSCTRGQAQPQRILSPFSHGQEGPRTHIVSSTGKLYIAGTGHKGLAADHLHKVLYPKRDHLSFYEVGSRAADATVTPVPTGAAEGLRRYPAEAATGIGLREAADFGRDGNTHYLDTAQIIMSQPSHIHSVALAADGRMVCFLLYIW